MENAQQITREAAIKKTDKKARIKWNFARNWPLHLMVLPAFLVVLLFQYGPLPGLIMAFQQYKPWLGFTDSPFVGLDQFAKMWEFPQSRQVILNTLIIASLKVLFQLIVPFVFALLLNEIRAIGYKRTIQTMVYLPHFLSWVILGGILIDMLSTDGGMVNRILGAVFGIEPIFSWVMEIGSGLRLWSVMCGRILDLLRSYSWLHLLVLTPACMRQQSLMAVIDSSRCFISPFPG